MDKRHSTAIKYLCLTVLVLFGAPKINIKVGLLPFYLIDILIFLTVFNAKNIASTPYQIPYKNIVNFVLIMILSNELLNGILIQNIFPSIYIMIRMSLAVSLFFVIPKIIRSPKELLKVVKYGLVGAFITTLLLILSSLPITRGLSNIILSIPFLNPNSSSLSYALLNSADGGMRGSSLIGVSILSGAFLNVIWPLFFLMLNFYKPKGIVKLLLIITLILTPVAIVMTYSRGAILALFLIVIGFMIFQKGKIRAISIIIAVTSYVLFNTIGFSSKTFMFDRVINRTEAALSDPYNDERESERILAYSQPFEHLLKNPAYLFVGEGFARNREDKFKVLEGNKNRGDRADHAVFAAAYYAYGLITSLSIIFLFVSFIKYTLKFMSKSSYNNLFSAKFTRIIFIVLFGFSSWFTFGHAAISTPRGAMLMFFLFGLVASQKNMYIFDKQQKLNSKNSK